jgi:hypothetical protein
MIPLKVNNSTIIDSNYTEMSEISKEFQRMIIRMISKFKEDINKQLIQREYK